MSVLVSSERVLFRGEARTASVKGRVLSIRCQAGSSAFDRRVPRFRIQPGCNHTLFDVGCGLIRDEWRFTAVVADPGVAGFPFEFALSGLTRVSGVEPVYFENWFAGGWIQFGTGTTWCRRPILRSTNVTGGLISVTLSRDPEPFPQVGDAVSLFPGCDGRWETCGPRATENLEGKYNNRLNFGGHPFVPAANPSLVKVSTAVAGGKKS